MGINVFGIKIEIPQYEKLDDLEGFLEVVVKKKEERVILRKFLLASSLNDQGRFEEIKSQSREQDYSITPEGNLKDQVTEFCIERLKGVPTSVGISLYEDLVLQLIESNGSSNSRHYAKRLRLKGEVKQDIPGSFPGDHKQSEALIVGKLRGDIGKEEFKEYLAQKAIKTKIGVIIKDLFFAINHGLEKEKVLQFMGILYELRRLQTAEPTNEKVFRENLVDSIKSGNELTLVHIKCLRFTYPYGNRLELLVDCEDKLVPTKDGGRHYPLSEKQIIARLQRIRDIFIAFGIRAKLLILLSDQDLLDYFPYGNGAGMVPDSDVKKAGFSFRQYEEKISSFLGAESVGRLREHLRQKGLLAKFDLLKEGVLQELKRGKGNLNQGFVESRVNYRYESNKKIFVIDPGRQFARDRVYSQLASLQALEVLGINNNGQRGNLLLIEEDRGDENAFIGGYKKSALPVFFTQLRDEVILE